MIMRPDHHIALGAQDIQAILLAVGVALLLVAMLGMLTTSEDSKCLAKTVRQL